MKGLEVDPFGHEAVCRCYPPMLLRAYQERTKYGSSLQGSPPRSLMSGGGLCGALRSSTACDPLNRLEMPTKWTTHTASRGENRLYAGFS